MKKYHLYGLGAALVDTEIDVVDQDLVNMGVEKGLMTLVDQQRQHQLSEHLKGHMVHAKMASGGSACNSIYAASCFGATAFYSCKVANDDSGQFFLNDLANANIDCKPQDHGDEGVTGKCLVLISPDAERSMNTHLGISESLSEQQLDVRAIANSQYLYFEGYLVTSDTGRAAAIKARTIAEQHQVKTAISLSDPAMVEFFKDGLKTMIGSQVDLLFCNEAEAKSWAQTEDIETAITVLKGCAKTFAITLGAEGALIFDGNEILSVDAHPTNAIDTNGAGDMFAGAFLYAITHGHSYQFAGELASLAAAQVVSHYGPRLAADDHEKLTLKLQANN